MLSHLYIRDFTIVERLELAFEQGFTVLTGETGAGKSILVDALAFALGARADSTIIRQGCRQAEISASFDVPADSAAARWLRAHELFAEEECVLRRLVETDKASRGFINGRPVPIQMLRELGEHLVDIHGQHEYQSILRRDGQRELLDDFAGLAETIDVLAEHYRTLRALEARRERLLEQSSDRAARMELLRYQVKELEALGLSVEEIVALDEEQRRLANGAELLAGLQAITHTLYEDERASAAGVLARAVQRLEQLAQYDSRLAALAELLNEARIRVDEAAGELQHYADRFDLDPQRLERVEQQLALVHDLARKHRAPAQELPQVLTRLRSELADLDDADLNSERLEQDIAARREDYLKLAAEVSQARRKAAKKLSEQVSALMQELGMPGGRFAVELSALPADELAATGRERVEFAVSANPGQELRPLAKVASGGELSRIGLALHVVAARRARIPVLIFDEVDVGIGGRVAEIVGQMLRELGRSREVLCITHLAQVAALGDHHLQVSKTAKTTRTFTEVRALSERERVAEIARMIGGIKISQQTLEHARDMLTRALASDRVSA